MNIFEITSFKNRVLDKSKPVEIYRNLNKRGKWYSIRQGGLVVGHVKHFVLRDCKCVVRRSGWLRWYESGVRNVHAWVRGYYDDSDPKILESHFMYDIEYGHFRLNGVRVDEVNTLFV